MALTQVTKYEQVPLAIAKLVARKEARSVRAAIAAAAKPEVRVAGGRK
jgi:hypothetical protein